MKLSIIIPIKNEQENIGYLYQELIAVLKQLGLEYEIIAINDGSTDQSGQVLNQIAVNDEKFKVVEFNRNYGQTPALAAGFAYAQGDIIIPMDADLENDPNDVPRLLAELDKGYDIVSGWRKTRWQNKLWTRKIPSIMASWLISKLVGLRLHDMAALLRLIEKKRWLILISTVRCTGLFQH